MAESAKPSDDGSSDPSATGEQSTVAMESPGVAPGVPLPISSPPPPMAPAANAPKAPARPLGPPGIPQSSRSPSAARVPLPSSGGGAGASGAGPGSARMPGAPPGPPGLSAKRTVMGLAPPANPHAPSTGSSGGVAPVPNRAPGVAPSARSPIAPAVAPAKAAPVAPSAGSPSAPKAPAAAPAKAGDIPRVYDESDEDPDDGPTMASDPGQFAEMQAAAAANYPLSNPPPAAAPAKAAGSPGASQTSPLSSTAYTPPAPPKKAEEEERSEENDAATVTVPKDVLDRVRANPKALLEESKAKAPTPAAGRPYSDMDDSAEPTKAVPRDQLLGTAAQTGKDSHVVIGAGAGGEDATLAVPPGANEASGINLGAAIGDSLKGTGPMDGGFPPPPGAQPHPYQSVQGMGPMSGGQMPMGPQGPQDWGHPGMQQGGPGMPMGMQGQMPGQMQGQPWSSGHMPAAIPRTPGGAPSYGGGPMMQGQGQGGIPRAQAPTNWNPLQAPPKSKVSGQMILLVVVGFVCLAIFVTGIVLFATTKF